MANKLTSFFREKKIVCLGGGIGTVNVISGLKRYTKNITVVVSMADEGGSAGRLRRLYNIFPPGDIISCIAALNRNNKLPIKELLTYRFTGNRYGKDEHLVGHKMGNLMMVALRDITGSFEGAIHMMQKLFNIEGTFLPATKDHVSISATTIEGKEIIGEEKIDLGRYKGKRVIDSVFLHPQNVAAADGVVEEIMNADAIIFGPGDLYTALLPVLLVHDIAEAVRKTSAKKIFVINVANKPFETRNYSVSDYMHAVEKHIGTFPFDTVIVNNNYALEIPKMYHYQYVKYKKLPLPSHVTFINENLVNEAFPLYHSPEKLAKVIRQNI